MLLRNYCSTIHHRYEDNPLFEKHLDYFINKFNFAPRSLANKIQEAFEHDLPEYHDPSGDKIGTDINLDERYSSSKKTD